MKRTAAALLALLLLLGAAGAWAEPAGANHLTVGNPTPMRGEFFTEMWGNATSDIDVRDLLHGYNLVMWDGEYGRFAVDPSVVSGMAILRNEAGDKTFVLSFCHDLYYSDGSRITAWDYAFSFLFMLSPEVAGIGGVPLRREQFAGYSDYVEGRGPLSGVHVPADDILTVTLRHEFLPFFYELGLLLCNPYPISVIAPGVEVRDDGAGVYLANIDPAVTEPLFTAELLRTTVMDPETGYLSHPAVVSGPYTLTAWDGVTADFAINPFYKGNARGEKPSIATLTYTLAENETMIGLLEEGAFGLLNKVTRRDQIEAGLALTGRGPFAMEGYPRIGLSYISFACERPTVSSQAVRQAIAWCMDRDQVTEDYTGGFGQRVDGYYGIGQWMYELISGDLRPPVTAPADANDAEAQAAWEAQLAAYAGLSLENLTPYRVDTARAAELLEKDGWLLNEDGLREKDGVVLDLHMIYPEGNNVNESFEVNLIPHLAEAGIRLTLEAVPMAELLSRWYKQAERSDDMIYLASNFYIVFDPSVSFHEDHSWAYTNLTDEELYAAAEAMRTTEPGDVLGYMRQWIRFQERFNTALPMLPVYSNLYFDFFTSRLKRYEIMEPVTWGEAIVPAALGE